jgi:hypothetical protein
MNIRISQDADQVSMQRDTSNVDSVVLLDGEPMAVETK